MTTPTHLPRKTRWKRSSQCNPSSSTLSMKLRTRLLSTSGSCSAASAQSSTCIISSGRSPESICTLITLAKSAAAQQVEVETLVQPFSTWPCCCQRSSTWWSGSDGPCSSHQLWYPSTSSLCFIFSRSTSPLVS